MAIASVAAEGRGEIIVPVMKISVAIAMFGWIAVVLILTAVLPRRRAVAVAYVFGWLFLPVASYPIAGLPDYTKMMATCAAPLLALCIFDFRRLLSLRPSWTDLPVLLFCVSPFVSSLVNGLGIHEGLSAVFVRGLSWGVPYAIGRLYFQDLEGLRELAVMIFAGGAVYVPLCLFELWSGPQLSKLVYGYIQLNPVISFGIVRPRVFMQTSLMLALFMAAATVIAIWLWRSGALPAVRTLSLGWFVPLMIATVILARSVNGWIAAAIGAALLFTCHRWRTTVPVVGLMILIVGYVAVRAAGFWSGAQIVGVARSLLNEKKGQSIKYRLENEDLIARNSRQRPLFGWGRQDSVLFDQQTGQRLVPDSMWIIVFATSGVFGLVGLVATILFPVVLFARSVPPDRWRELAFAPAAVLAVVLLLYMTDHLANAMEEPVFMLAAGGISGLALMSPKATSIRSSC